MNSYGITRLRLLASMMFLSGMIILGYFWKILGERGMYADETGTGGYTTGIEAALILVGLVLVVCSIVLVVVSSSRKK